MKVYVTLVVPSGKIEFGVWLLDIAGLAWESSVAVGSIHVACPPVAPTGTVTVISTLGHPLITGGVTSESISVETVHLRYIVVMCNR